MELSGRGLTQQLYTLSGAAGAFLSRFCDPWEALEELPAWLIAYGQTLSEEYKEVSEHVWVHQSAAIAPSSALVPPCIIERGAEIRNAAFLRGCVYVGEGSVVGNSTELKTAILLAGAKLPHFNYAGDSIIGCAHLGAGVILSNVRGDRMPISVRLPWGSVPTGRRKLGAMVGDGAEVGCNAVINPGSVLFPFSRVEPLASVRGYLSDAHLYKRGGNIVPLKNGITSPQST